MRSPEVQLTIELEKLVKDNCSMRSPELQLTIEIEIVSRKLQSVKLEVQLQLNLIA
jgi:hypothetical protein